MNIKVLFLSLLLLAGCTSNVKEFGDVVSVEKAPIEKTPFEADANIASYTVDKQSEKAEWVSCRLKKAKGLALLVNRDAAPFNPKGACEGWLAQAFLAEGYDVLGVNRPGFGESSGPIDLGGSQSVLALDAAVKAYQAVYPSPKITGAWGLGAGAIAASQFAKKHRELSWLILGNGIYDAEQTMRQTPDAALKADLERVARDEKEVGLEKRSIAWDFGGLPKTVVLYHAELDETIPSSQASAFRDSLAAQEHQARLLILEKVGHDLPVDLHYGALRRILSEVASGEK